MTNNHSDVLTEAAKAVPTVTVGGLTLYGVGLSDYVLVLTLVYTMLQILFLLRDKWWKPRKGKNGRK